MTPASWEEIYLNFNFKPELKDGVTEYWIGNEGMVKVRNDEEFQRRCAGDPKQVVKKLIRKAREPDILNEVKSLHSLVQDIIGVRKKIVHILEETLATPVLKGSCKYLT